jgi:2-polyprenyl-3-methyl-5-hydroxy-6-metoxy-1,4-benzoquinol methylase
MQLISKTTTTVDMTGQTVVQAPVCHSSHNLLSSAWVERWLTTAVRRTHIASENGIKTTHPVSALDWACGAGRHSVLAARLGCRVLGVDKQIAAAQHNAKEQGVAINLLQADLESNEADSMSVLLELAQKQDGFDVIVVSNYLFRPRIALLVGLLAPGGMLIYETFAQGNERYGKPSRADFLLAPHELLDRTRSAGLHVLGFEQGYVELPMPAVTQRIAAYRPL